MRKHAEGAGELSPYPSASMVSRRLRHLTRTSVPTARISGHFPTRIILACPFCHASIARFSALVGRFGDSVATCPRRNCRQRAPRADWRVAA